MQTTNALLNGVDLKRLTENIAAISAKPELANFQFRAVNQWVDGGYNQSVIRDFHGVGQEIPREAPFILANDEPDVLLGEDKAPNPVEYVLHALAGCITTSTVYHAAARGFEIKKVQTTFEGDLDLRGFLGIDPTVRKGYKEIRVAIDIEGNFSEEEKKVIQKLAEFSPVLDIVSNTVPVKINYKINQPAELIDY
jgi:uncharacterized OsmC-like protein